MPDIFSDETYKGATLYMSEKGIKIGKTIDPWKNFEKIEVKCLTGLENVTASIDATLPIEVYNMEGVFVGSDINAVPSGIYIVRQGNTTKKVAVK